MTENDDLDASHEANVAGQISLGYDEATMSESSELVFEPYH